MLSAIKLLLLLYTIFEESAIGFTNSCELYILGGIICPVFILLTYVLLFKNLKNIYYKKSIKEAISSIDLKDNDIIIITGSLYLAGEVLNLN